jgi:hypothetical protein
MSLPVLHRLSPCGCGSGESTARCCLPWEEEYQRLASRAFALAETPELLREEPRAAELFWAAEEGPGGSGRDTHRLRFLEWFLTDYSPADGRGALLGELADRAADATPLETPILLGMLLAPVRAYQVAEGPGPRQVAVKDLLTGEEHSVATFGLGRLPIRSDILVCRLVPLGRMTRIGIGVIRLPAGCREELSAYLRMAYQVSRTPRHVSLEDFLDGAPHLYQHYFLSHGVPAGGAAWTTVRGASYAPGRAIYRVKDAERLRAALSRQAEIETETAGESEGRYLWIDPAWGTGRARLTLSADLFTVGADSREDLAEAAAFVAQVLHGTVEAVGLESDEEPMAESPTISSAEPRGSRFLRRAIRQWPDAAAPALGGRSPRAAVVQADGRRQAAALLAGMERDLARLKRLGRGWVDVSGVWAALGIPELAPARPARRVAERTAPPPGGRKGGPRRGPKPRGPKRTRPRGA